MADSQYQAMLKQHIAVNSLCRGVCHSLFAKKKGVDGWRVSYLRGNIIGGAWIGIIIWIISVMVYQRKGSRVLVLLTH